MGRRSKARQLPPELLEELNRLLVDGRMTYEQLAQHLRQLGGDVSKDGVWRYAKQREKVNERIRLANEMAQALGKQLKDLPEEDHERATHEILHATLLQAATNLAQLDEPDVEAVMTGAIAADKLASAKKKNIEAFGLRAKIRAEEAARAAKIVERAGAQRGLSIETVSAIKAEILGIERTA